MGIILNTTTINSMWKGTTQVNRVYFGDVLVFGAEPTPSGVTITSDGKGLVIPANTSIQSYSDPSGKYTLPISITINDVSINQHTTTTNHDIYYTSGVTEEQFTYQTGTIFSGSPSTGTNTTYGDKTYTTIAAPYQYAISTFDYSGSGAKSIVTEQFPFRVGLPSGTYNSILGAFNINTSNVDNVQFYTTVQIQQDGSGSNPTTVNSLYAVDANGNTLKEYSNVNLTSGTRAFDLDVNSSTPLPVYLLADIDYQDTTINIYIKGYCRYLTTIDYYNTLLYLNVWDEGYGAMGRRIRTQTTTLEPYKKFYSLKVNTDGTIYDLTT